MHLNACCYRDGIHSYDNIHIATAVDTPDGLLAPVVRDVDRLALYQIADRTRRLVAQARCGQRICERLQTPNGLEVRRTALLRPCSGRWNACDSPTVC